MRRERTFPTVLLMAGVAFLAYGCYVNDASYFWYSSTLIALALVFVRLDRRDEIDIAAEREQVRRAAENAQIEVSKTRNL